MIRLLLFIIKLHARNNIYDGGFLRKLLTANNCFRHGPKGASVQRVNIYKKIMSGH